MTVFCELIIFFFFNDTATTEIYTLSLHDALPIWSVPDVPLIRPAKTCLRRYGSRWRSRAGAAELGGLACVLRVRASTRRIRSEEHTSELQSRQYLVCRLLLEKKNNTTYSSLLRRV